jgi:hypothetical protein
MVGRVNELAMLHTALENVASSQTQLIIVAGEAGIGKSACWSVRSGPRDGKHGCPFSWARHSREPPPGLLGYWYRTGGVGTDG